MMVDALELTHAGLSATVTKNDGHPEGYLWIDLHEERTRRFFLDVQVPGMTRRDVRGLAQRWLEARTERLRLGK